MFPRVDEAQEFQAELRLWEAANQRRDVVLDEIASRVALQTERDGFLLRKLEAASARLALAICETRLPKRELALV
jgi:hypothetical protein